MRKLLGVARRRGSRCTDVTAETAASASVEEKLFNASGCIESRLASLDVQLERCDHELASLRGQLSGFSAQCVGQTTARQKALMLLKRKKLLQHHRESLLYSQLSIDQAYIANDSLNVAHQTSQVLQETNNALQKSLESQAARQCGPRQRKSKIGTVADLQCELQDLNFDAQTTTELLLGGSLEDMQVGFGVEVSAELEAELQQLMDSTPPGDTSLLAASRPTSSSSKEVPHERALPLQQATPPAFDVSAPAATSATCYPEGAGGGSLVGFSTVSGFKSEQSALEDITDWFPPIPKHTVGFQPRQQQLRN